ncbi:hypothetical protein PIB30_086358, partial [Stylosanthes scabra]|nr:hypothetical protein [Stylosanthes scabra]
MQKRWPALCRLQQGSTRQHLCQTNCLNYALQTCSIVALTHSNFSKENMVPAKPERTLIATVSIRALLRQACKRLEMSDPIYRLVKNHVPKGRLACRHLVSLVPPNSDTAVVVPSRIAFDQSESYDDATRLGVRRLCRLLGGYVDDYSHDQYHLWRKRFNNLGRDYVAMEARLEELKQQNEQLRRQASFGSSEPQPTCDGGLTASSTDVVSTGRVRKKRYTEAEFNGDRRCLHRLQLRCLRNMAEWRRRPTDLSRIGRQNRN